MAITYKSQGAGASTATSGAALSPAAPATVDAGDILIGHAAWNNTTDSPSTPSGWTLLDGPRNIGTTPNGRHWIFGKIADGTEDGASISFGTAGGTTKRWGRIYSFAGRVAGAIDALVNGFAATAHATDPQMPTVTTTKAGALAVACVAQNDDNTVASATGESGGDWVEAVAEYTATTGAGVMMQIQTATPTGDPGTISGGSAATANDPCGVIGFQVRDNTVTTTTTIAATAVGVASVTTAATFRRTIAATAIGVATVSAIATFRTTVAATAVGVAALATQFTAYVGSAWEKLCAALLVGRVHRR